MTIITRFIAVFMIIMIVSLMLPFTTLHALDPIITSKLTDVSANRGFIDAGSFGFSPLATGTDNAKALQRAVDQGGTVVVSQPGTYALADTVYLDSNTSLIFGNGIFVKKVNEHGEYSHVLLNRGALTKTYNEHILVSGLQVIVNGMDVRTFKDVYGLHGQIGFFYVKDLRIDRFRCLDLGKKQYGIHICTFEDVIIDDVIIAGDKDGVHLGRGKRFTIRNGAFKTFDDAVALNAHDYDVGNPELGWIEDGVVENCHDLADGGTKVVGYFCRILAGAWIDWRAGMIVQKSDTVVSNGRLYRVFAVPDGKTYTSTTQPTHLIGKVTLDGINWVMVQNDVTNTAGVRNVTFRDIFLHKPRIGFSVHFDEDKYSRSYYPGAPVPQQEQLVFDNIRILYPQQTDFMSIGTPMDVITILHSSFGNNRIHVHGGKALSDYLPTKINLIGCVFNHPGALDLIVNDVPKKQIVLKTFASVEMSDQFSAQIKPGDGSITVTSDLTGLRK